MYKYGAVPLEQFPKEGIDELFRENRLWNTLVEIHNDNVKEYDEARRKADAEYDSLASQLEALEEEISAAYEGKRATRMKAGTRDASHPLINEANQEIKRLKDIRYQLWQDIKVPRKRADDLLDKKSLTASFREKTNAAQHVKNTGGLKGQLANEVNRNFREARAKVFKTPKARLRFHRFDGTGYFFYRFRDRPSGTNHDGLQFEEIFSKGATDGRAFILEDNGMRGGKPRLKLRAKLAGGAKADSKVYAFFDIVMHRSIPKGAQINNAKLMRNRVGDRFKYTVNFSVRVPAAEERKADAGVIGVDIGFRSLPDGTLRAAMVHNSADSSFETVAVSKEHMNRIDHILALQGAMDDAATELGNSIKLRLKEFLATRKEVEEGDRFDRFIRAIARAPENVTLSFETAYKLGSWLQREPGQLPERVEDEIESWHVKYARRYREMHHLRKKTLGWRKEKYRVIAKRLVSFGIPIGIEAIDLSVFAEVKDGDNKLSNRARSQRFLVSPSEFIGAIKNAAEREGVPVFEVGAANTSKECHACGKINEALTSELEWTCPKCGAEHDRDENAAVNIGLRALEKLRKERERKAK